MNEGARMVHEGLKRSGIDLVTSVPCVNLKELLDLIDADPDIKHVPVTREEEGIGICAGAYMGGMRTAIVMQNSGLGNCVNALASLNLLYGIPLLMVISHRGMEGEQIVAQVPMGRLTEPLLRELGIPTFVHSRPQEGAIAEAWNVAMKERRPAALLLKPSFWR